LGDIKAVDGFKELIQFILLGSLDEIEEKSDQDVEGEFSLTREGFFGFTVTGNKFW